MTVIKLVPPPSVALPLRHEGHPQQLEIIAETNRRCLGLLPPFHEKTAGLRENIVALDVQLEDWQVKLNEAHERGGDSTSPLVPAWRWGWIVVLAAEISIATTALEGLNVGPVEALLNAAGATLMAGLTASAAAVVANAPKSPSGVTQKRIAWVCIAGMFLVMAGQAMARYGFFSAEGGGEEALLSTLGLSLLQVGMLTGVCGVMLAGGSSIKAAACEKKIARLTRQRMKLAADLNRHVATLRAAWAIEQARGRSLICEFAVEMANNGKPIPDCSLDDSMFLPLPPCSA